jgi:hypothetical protein
MQEKHKSAKRQVSTYRARCRDDKYAGRAGPPDCCEVLVVDVDDDLPDDVPVLQGVCEADDSVCGWDVVEKEQDLHSPRSCHPPCTSHTQARCTVS